YDYYQPEAYVPQTDTYIEKDSAINEHIDKLRLRATASLLSRRDTVVVASVSCIYNIGLPESFSRLCLVLRRGDSLSRTALLRRLTEIRYERNEVEFVQGRFRARGGSVDVFPPYAGLALRITLEADRVISLQELDDVSGELKGSLEQAYIYPAKHFVSTASETERGIAAIRAELAQALPRLEASGKLLEAQRLKQRTEYDLEMLEQTGFCSGIENYSRHLAGRAEGERPACLLDYFKKDDFLLFLDESHVGVPQIRGMYEGDRSRKQTLVDFGFRLPSALDNRPLRFEEFERLMPQTVFISATPGPYELKAAGKQGVAEQIIRPTGLVDPPVTIHPSEGQIQHLMQLIKERAAKKERALVLTLTKKTAEDVAAFLSGKGLRVNYLHSEIEALERVKILQDLRRGEFDVLVGINLLREGLDIPEVSLVAILEADNEGFLRSETTLVQIAGRAARNLSGEVVLYADRVT
ncbi:MAG TPA: helicase-related protein, partial [Elusimicrobiales bacterium]|nr:helicase-related protein [Elusimicrobiales bacterium]